MNKIEHLIIDALQNEFPLCENPYQVLAEKLGIPFPRFMETVKQLIQTGTIRRIGASLDSRKLGYCSTLAGVSVPKEQVEQASEIISSYPEITHSYLRADTFNIWFTLIAESQTRIDEIIAQIRERLSLGENALLNVPVKRLFKLDARFKTKL